MSKVVEAYYQCDYCNTKFDLPNLKYTDNSGLDDKCYDMCSDECREKHIEYLESRLSEGDLGRHIEYWLPIRN